MRVQPLAIFAVNTTTFTYTHSFKQSWNLEKACLPRRLKSKALTTIQNAVAKPAVPPI